jgi:hypothetical protein
VDIRDAARRVTEHQTNSLTISQSLHALGCRAAEIMNIDTEQPETRT